MTPPADVDVEQCVNGKISQVPTPKRATCGQWLLREGESASSRDVLQFVQSQGASPGHMYK